MFHVYVHMVGCARQFLINHIIIIWYRVYVCVY
jgi:hypothetical protein